MQETQRLAVASQAHLQLELVGIAFGVTFYISLHTQALHL